MMVISGKSDSIIRRCPACGQKLSDPPPTKCPLCEFDFGDSRVTGDDTTPYAEAYACGLPGWRRMAEWIWFADTGRVKHLALMRASAASRRFCIISFLLLAVGLALFQTSRVGWRWVTASPAVETTGSVEPAGEGWLRVAGMPRPLPPELPAERAVDLWWNPAQTLIGVVLAFLAALLLLWMLLAFVRRGLDRAHVPSMRGEQRMTAALHYSTAWNVLLVIGALVTILRPIGYIGRMRQWAWSPADQAFTLPAGVFAAFGVTMWWFWLVRLGSVAAERTRGRVVAFFGLGVPLMMAVAVLAWWQGLDRLYPLLFDAMKMKF